MVKSDGAAVHPPAKPGTARKRDRRKGQRSSKRQNKLNGNDHLNGQSGNHDADGSQHRAGLGNPDEPDKRERKSGRPSVDINNGEWNSNPKPRKQRTDGPGLQLRDNRLTLEMVVGEAIPTVWERFGVGQLFADSEWRSGGRWNADYLFEKLTLKHMQLWLIIEKKNERENIKAALITDVRPYENGFKACHIVAVVGEEPRSWIKLKPALEDWAKRSGCEAIETIGRIGWKRVIPDWKPTHIFLEKRL